MVMQDPEHTEPAGVPGGDHVVGPSTVAGAFASAGTALRRPWGSLPRRAIGHLKSLVGNCGTVVDLCAGTGALSGALWRAGCPVVAVEYRSDMLEQFRRSLPSLPAVRADPTGLPLRSGSVRAAIYCAFLAGPPIESLMDELERIADPQGILIRVDSSEVDDSPVPVPRARLEEVRSFEGEPGDRAVLVSVWTRE